MTDPVEASVAELQARVVALEGERHKLQRINQALIGRIESSAMQSDEAYGVFQYSMVLAEQVRKHIDVLSQMTLELKASNQLLSDARLRAEIAHQHLLDTIESISDAFALFDPQQHIVLFNKRFRVLRVDSRARIGPGMRRTELHRLVRSGRLIVEEQCGGDQQILYCLRDERWLRMSERSTRDGGLAALYSDITEIKPSETARREQVLTQKSYLLRRAVDNLSQGVTTVGANDVLELWNRRFLELYGLALIAGYRASAEVMAESELPLLMSRSQDPQGSSLNVREQRPFDDRVLEIRIHALPTGGFVNTFIDITERYRHAEALRVSERWTRLITDQVPALIAYLSDELVCEFTNKAYGEWYRWPNGPMLGRYLRDVYGAKHCWRLGPYFKRTLAGEGMTFEIVETALPGEERYIQRSYAPNRQANGRVAGLFVLVRGITERQRTTEALHQAYQDLRQRIREQTAELTTLNDQLRREIHEHSQVEARLREAKHETEQANLPKTKFLAAVNHDLLQPLNAARLFTGALQERGSAVLDNEALMNDINHSLEDVENLLGTLVGISKLDAGVITPDIVPFELGELLDNLAAEYRQVAASEGLRLDLVVCGVLVRSDQQLFARIPRNLLSNAIRYIPRRRVLLGCRRRRQRLSIEVWDTGVGIAADKLGEVFQEFKRGESQRCHQGRGLGLRSAIVDKIVRMLGYRVRVGSLLGKGSCFAIEVPLIRHAPCSRAEPLASTDDPRERLRGSWVWVLDNDVAICVDMCTLLEAWGYRVVTAPPEEDLTRQIDNYHVEADLLIVDHHLNDQRNGVDAAATINARHGSSLPALMTTVNCSNELK